MKLLTGRLQAGEAIPALWLLAAAAMLILPLPTALVDGLLALNICLAVIMVLLSVRVAESLQVSAFPTLLLGTTLFRLALNVSTTRLILSEGDAGAVVAAFGRFATAGNPVVGGVVFCILAVVQFVVIAKGAERVAEVSARFTLDAMPGKQMSIDADLRAGAIDGHEAARRRSALEREAQFHGAMDGAMKFVKGDAVAGLLIVVVNLVGGLVIGCVQRGLGLSEAFGAYAVLTVGDGLVSQIPALLIATSAGLVVTRVRPERSGWGLGRQISGALAGHPEVFFLAAAVLALVGIVPGMPLCAFGLLALVCCAAGLAIQRRRPEGSETASASRPSPLRLQLGPGWREPGELAVRLDALRTAVAEDLGLALPVVEARIEGAGQGWRLWLDDVPVAAGSERRASEAWWGEIERALRRVAARFVGVQECQDLLDRVEQEQPALVREVVPRLVPPVLLAEVLTRLVEEQVPIRNLRLILASLAEWARSEADPMVLAERVRESLRATISHRVAPDGTLRALLLDPEIERKIEQALSRSERGTTLALDPEDGEAILRGLERSLASPDSPGVIVTRPGLRRPFWRLAEQLDPVVRVVSFVELEPGTQIQPVGRIAAA
ncbi:MAG: FHIPEP family type III secretion protein [Deltaproteobacteria bacterium]|nr:FHIPEP family type III secretion protein [Deltaproteobacteria bacterium]